MIFDTEVVAAPPAAPRGMGSARRWERYPVDREDSPPGMGPLCRPYDGLLSVYEGRSSLGGGFRVISTSEGS